MSGVIIYLGRLSPIASSDQPETSGPHTFPFGLASDGVYRDPCCYQQSGGLLHHLSTLTDGKSRSGIFLLHFPWSRLHRMLSGILSCGARTFLVFSPRSPGPLNLIQHKAALRSFRIPQSLFRWKPAWPARWAIPYCSLNILYHPILP